MRLSSFNIRVFVIALPGIIGVVVMLFLPAISQPAAYHQFADQRSFLGIPHCLNVLSNVPYVVAGALGLYFVLRPKALEPGGAFLLPAERWAYVFLFVGVFLTGFGSSYYHLDPSTERLVGDRLPMTIAFMSLFAATISERIHVRLGIVLLVPLLFAGIASALYWHFSEIKGQGDLRPYILVQFYPLVAIPLMMLLFPARYTDSSGIWAALAWYAIAKVFEFTDEWIYSFGHIVSGHTLKHLSSAAGAYAIARMIEKRTPAQAASGITPAP